jgi:hypothetical protein
MVLLAIPIPADCVNDGFDGLQTNREMVAYFTEAIYKEATAKHT